MASRQLANILRYRDLTSLHSSRHSPLPTTVIPSIRCIGVRVRHFTQRPSLRSPASTPSVPATIITEFRKAGVRYTKSGTEALNKMYASTSYSRAFKADRAAWFHYDVYQDAQWGEEPIYFDTPGELSSDSANRLGICWRSEDAYYRCLNYKVYKLWEALHARSPLFRPLIDEQEAYLRWRERYRAGSMALWDWMRWLIDQGFLEREDVDNLPEPFMLRDILVPSDQAVEVFAGLQVSNWPRDWQYQRRLLGEEVDGPRRDQWEL
ncbi:hypothetical protein Dda_5277 [Drechslerella dactyloides]|uniref:Uncharacterized protein n=1 Tax=Drechslerella dactyloides TaxID=74499 RepID=A0AAD6IX91_DREDA|nr:hypothetical protein Dda_5277 [Drechslerella dactyloides]